MPRSVRSRLKLHFRLQQPADCPWEAPTLRGFSAWRHGSISDAILAWTCAHDAIADFADSDARRAAALNNAACAMLLDAKRSEAARLIDEASKQWTHSRRALATAAQPLTGRGSVFHIQLAARNGDAFAERHRHDLQVICDAGQAITAFNSHCITSASQHPQPCRDADAWIAAVEAAFGPHVHEVRAMRTLALIPSDGDAPVDSPALHARWRMPAAHSRRDATGIRAAAHLTALIDFNPFHSGRHA